MSEIRSKGNGTAAVIGDERCRTNLWKWFAHRRAREGRREKQEDKKQGYCEGEFLNLTFPGFSPSILFLCALCVFAVNSPLSYSLWGEGATSRMIRQSEDLPVMFCRKLLRSKGGEAWRPYCKSPFLLNAKERAFLFDYVHVAGRSRLLTATIAHKTMYTTRSPTGVGSYPVCGFIVQIFRESRKDGSCPATVTGDEICTMPLSWSREGFTAETQRTQREKQRVRSWEYGNLKLNSSNSLVFQPFLFSLRPLRLCGEFQPGMGRRRE